MIPRYTLPLLAALVLLGAAPALAQSQTEGHGDRPNPQASVAPEALTPQQTPPLPGNATVSLNPQRWRASQLLGADVYSSENHSIGKVEDLLFTPEGGLAVVISSGGLLGMGGRLVSVPYDRLQHSERWVLPGENAETLKQMPEFKFE